jgi:signal transduction histidine kinase
VSTKAGQLHTGKVVDLREEVIDSSWGTLTAEVDAQGRAHCQLNAKGLRGTQTYVSKPKFKAVAGAKLRLGILPVQKEEARKPQVLSKYTVKEIVTDWGGVQVRYNGFRMFPYGDVRDDWLGIDLDRGRRLGKPDDDELFNFAKTRDRIDPSRFLLSMLSMRSYIGQVSVSSKVNGLFPRIDRQGFVENPAFRSLRDFARFTVDWATVFRDYYIRLREHDEAERARKEIAPVLNLKTPSDQLVPKAASYLRHEIKRIVRRLPPSQQKAAEKTLIQTVHAIETTSEVNRKQLEHLRLVASASTLTLLFAHEIRTILGTLGATATRLDQLAHQLGARYTKELSDVVTSLRDSRDRFEGLVSITGLVGAFRREDRLDDFHLRTAVDRAVKCFDLVKDNYKINIETEEVATELQVGPMIEGELYTVLLNLLSNSVKSVIAAGPKKPRIAFRAIQEDSNIKLSVLDNGIGLDPQFYDQVFTPFISDPSGQLYDRLQQHANPEDMHLFGTGSGLGLSIARDVLRSRGGSIRFVDPPESWSTCVEVTFP